jgi:hypothetical protein
MNENNFHDKISEILYNVIKKTNIFEKINEVKKITIGFIFFTSITSTTLLIKSYYDSYKNNIICNELKNKNIFFQKKIYELVYKFDKIIEKNNEIIKLLNNNDNIFLKDYLNTEKTLNIKSNLSNVDIVIDCTLNEQNEHNENNNEDYELLNECYDNIPCNNLKKTSGINRIFGFK